MHRLWKFLAIAGALILGWSLWMRLSSSSSPVPENSRVDGIESPSNWPLREISLPPGATGYEFVPGPWSERVRRLPQKGVPRSSRSKTTQWSVLFSYTGDPDAVFDHIAQGARRAGLTQHETVPAPPDVQEVAREVQYREPGARYLAKLRYWKISVKDSEAGSYQLLILDTEGRGAR